MKITEFFDDFVEEGVIEVLASAEPKKKDTRNTFST